MLLRTLKVLSKKYLCLNLIRINTHTVFRVQKCVTDINQNALPHGLLTNDNDDGVDYTQREWQRRQHSITLSPKIFSSYFPTQNILQKLKRNEEAFFLTILTIQPIYNWHIYIYYYILCIKYICFAVNVIHISSSHIRSSKCV